MSSVRPEVMESSQLFAAMSPVFWICRVSGVFPFSNNDFTISLFWSLFSIGLFGLVIANTYFFYVYNNLFEGFAAMMYFGLCFTKSVSVAVTVVFCFSVGGLYRQVMAAVLEIESFLMQLGVKFSYNTRLIVMDITLRVAFISVIAIFNYNWYRDDIVQLYLRAVGFYLTHWCINCIEMQIVALCTYLSSLTKSMVAYLPSPDVEAFLEASTALFEISENVNRLFSVSCFVALGAIFICTTLDSYFLIVILPQTHTRAVNFFAFGRCLARSYQLWRLVSAISSMSDQAKKLDAKLYTMALEDPTHQISKKKKVVLYFSMKQNIDFTACGFFSMNFALIHSVLAAITNYLVILVQFGTKPS